MQPFSADRIDLFPPYEAAILHAQPYERFSDSLVEGWVGAPVRGPDRTVIGVIAKAWVADDGATAWIRVEPEPRTWVCRACKRMVTASYMSDEHDATKHLAYQRKWNTVVGIGLAIATAGLLLQVASIVIRVLS